MASPNESGARVQGLREAKAAFQALPEIARESMLEGTETTLRLIQVGAQARLQASPSIQTRTLFNHVRFTLNKKSGIGRVGIATGTTTVTEPSNGGLGGRRIRFKGVVVRSASGRAKLMRPTRYAHLVEFGTKSARAEPFMEPAAAAQRQAHVARQKAAGSAIEKRMAAIGMRGAL
jgi:hypothetical protein